MNIQKILKTQKLAYHLARRRGYLYLAEDFAQEVLLRKLESPDRKATLSQLFIDFLRKTYSSSRVEECYEAKMKLEFPAIRLDPPIRYKTPRQDFPINYHEIITRTVIEDADEEPRHESYAHLFQKGKHKRAYELIFIQGMQLIEVAKQLDVTPGRVSQIFTEMKWKIKIHKKNKCTPR